MDKIKLLIAEDDRIYHTIYKDILQADKYKDIFDMTLVENGQEAIEEYQNLSPDIVLLDVLMPIMTGYDALKKIRETEKKSDKSAIIIMVTSLSDKDHYEEAINLGTDGYIRKPFDQQNIGEMILKYFKEKNSENN